MGRILCLNLLIIIQCNRITGDTTATPGADSLDFINYGYNVFVAELSTLTITNEAFTEDDVLRINGEDITSEQFEFNSDFASFSKFAASDAGNVDTEFNINDGNGAYGSLSLNRQRARATVTTTQYFMSTVRLRDPRSRLVMGEFSEMQWTSEFLDHLVELPRNYTVGDDLEMYKYFWNKFGTHLFNSIELGGIVAGTVVSDKCYVAGSFADEAQYTMCLNDLWSGKGPTQTECEDFSTDFAMKRITARGGDLIAFTSVVDSFDIDQEKLANFENWIDGLSLANYHVVGGQVQEIGYGLRQSIVIGDHTLNNYSSTALGDDEWMAIAEAMESAFDDYSDELNAIENNVNCDEDQFNCFGGIFENEDCICHDCTEAGWCCGLSQDESPMNTLPTSIVAVIVVAAIIAT